MRRRPAVWCASPLRSWRSRDWRATAAQPAQRSCSLIVSPGLSAPSHIAAGKPPTPRITRSVPGLLGWSEPRFLARLDDPATTHPGARMFLLDPFTHVLAAVLS